MVLCNCLSCRTSLKISQALKGDLVYGCTFEPFGFIMVAK